MSVVLMMSVLVMSVSMMYILCEYGGSVGAFVSRCDVSHCGVSSSEL